MSGFIYVMSNPSFSEGILKIGKSESDPSVIRKDALYSTGVPEPFEVEYYAFVEDHDTVEVNVHRELQNYRPNKNREFFQCSVPQAIVSIRKNAHIKYEEIFYKSPEQIKAEELKQKREAENQARILEQQKREEKRKQEQIRDFYIFVETEKEKSNLSNHLFYIVYSLCSGAALWMFLFLFFIVISVLFLPEDDGTEFVLWATNFFSVCGSLLVFLWLCDRHNKKIENIAKEAKTKFPEVSVPKKYL